MHLKTDEECSKNNFIRARNATNTLLFLMSVWFLYSKHLHAFSMCHNQFKWHSSERWTVYSAKQWMAKLIHKHDNEFSNKENTFQVFLKYFEALVSQLNNKSTKVGEEYILRAHIFGQNYWLHTAWCRNHPVLCLHGKTYLSSHLSVLCIASSTRGPVVVLLTTSSSCIMISAPIEFWMRMDSSGVSKMRWPSYGDVKLTPS